MIGIDTNILIWGLDQTCYPPEMQPQVELAKQFFQHITEEGKTLVIPAQVLAEFLVRNSDDERQEALAKIDESFPIAPLDFAAAGIAAMISSERDHCKEVRATFGLTRNCFKADINVLASAMAFGAERLVTGNGPEMKALAKGRIFVDTLEEYVAKYINPAPAPDIPLLGEDSGQKRLEFGESDYLGPALHEQAPSVDGLLRSRPQLHPLRRELRIAPSAPSLAFRFGSLVRKA